MRCKFCPYEFKRGGPERAFRRLRDHVHDQHPDKFDAATEGMTMEQRVFFGEPWQRDGDPDDGPV